MQEKLPGLQWGRGISVELKPANGDKVFGAVTCAVPANPLLRLSAENQLMH
jgi:hypothetical protein